jgi:hypothetical protein
VPEGVLHVVGNGASVARDDGCELRVVPTDGAATTSSRPARSLRQQKDSSSQRYGHHDGDDDGQLPTGSPAARPLVQLLGVNRAARRH